MYKPPKYTNSHVNNRASNNITIAPEDKRQLKELISYFKQRYGISIQEAVRILDKSDTSIPVSIFKTGKLSSLEAVVRFLRDNKRLSNKEVARVLNRKENTISIVYKKSLAKYSGELGTDSEYFFTVTKLQDRRFSVLETICSYLSEAYELHYSKIAELINRDKKTIWTVLKRANEKKV